MTEKAPLVRTQGGQMAAYGNIEMGGLAPSDLELPRVTLLQPTSPDLRDLKHLAAGMFINSVSKEVLPVRFVPLFPFKQYAKFVDGGSLEWSTMNRNEQRVIDGLKWGNTGDKKLDKPKVTEFLNFMCVFEGQTVPLILSFKRTAIRVGRQFLTRISMKPGGIVEMYKYAYELSSKLKEEGDQAWYKPLVFDVADKAVHVVKNEDVVFFAAMAKEYAPMVGSLGVSEEGTVDDAPAL